MQSFIYILLLNSSQYIFGDVMLSLKEVLEIESEDVKMLERTIERLLENPYSVGSSGGNPGSYTADSVGDGEPYRESRTLQSKRPGLSGKG
jgi:hypothetical protein